MVRSPSSRSRLRTCPFGALAFAAFACLASRAQAEPASTSPEQGYDLGDIPQPRSVAMGGAQAALGVSTNALFLNPANLPFARLYHIEALGAFTPEAKRQTYGGAIVDSLTNRIAGGIGGVWSQADPDGLRRTWTDLRLGIAYPLGDMLSVGMVGRYLRAEQGVAKGPLGASLASDGTDGKALFNTVTLDAGISVVPATGLRIGAVGRGLTNPGSALAPLNVIGGIGYVRDIVSVELDGLADFTTWGVTKGRFMGGLEVLAGGRFPLRAGYRYDEGLQRHAASAGLGYIDRKWSLEMGGRRDLTNTRPATVISFSLRYFYDGGRTEVTDGEPAP